MHVHKQERLEGLKTRGRMLFGSALVTAAMAVAPMAAYAADEPASDGAFAAASVVAQSDADAWDWIAKTGAAGQSTGESTQNALTYVDTVNDVLTAEDGSIVGVGGYDWKGLESIPENHGGCDGFVVKYNADHTEAWRGYVGGTGDDYFSSVAQLADGSYVAVGFAKSLDGDMSEIAKHTKATAYDGLIAKFDSASAADSAIAASKVAAFGGTGNDYFQDVAATADGGFVAVGRAASNDGDLAGKRDGAESSASALVVKFDKDLNQQWVTVVDASSKSYDEFYSVIEDAQGNYIASGYFAAPKGDLAEAAKGGKDGALVKLDKDGKVVWTKVYGSAGNDELSSVALDCNADGGVEGAQGYVVAGYATSLDNDLANAASKGFTAPDKGMPWMMRVDSDGALVNSRVIEAEAVDATADITAYEDGYLVAGSYKNASDVLGEADSAGNVYLARLRSDFSVAGAQTFGGAAKDVSKSLSVDEDGVAYLSGRFLSSEFCGLQLEAKKANGFIMQIDPSDLAAKPDAQFTIPVVAIKKGAENTAENKSMAGGCVYETAYVKQYGDSNEVTLYLQGITVMGTTIEAQDIAALKYDSDGDGSSDALAPIDNYDPDTHSRTVVIPVSDLSQKMTVFLHMADADLYFDTTEKIAVDDEPSFFESDAEKVENAIALIEAAAANPDAQNVAAAQAAYEALTDEQKALVPADAVKALDTAKGQVKTAEAAEKAAAEEADLANGTVKVEKASVVYTGKALTPAVTVTTKGGKKLAASDYTVAYKDNINAGTASFTVSGKGSYTGSKSATFKITKASQAIKAKKATKSLKANKKTKKLAKTKTIALKKLAKVSAKTKVVYAKANKVGGKLITVAKSGKVTVKKGLKKGTYKVNVKLSAAGNTNYKAAKAKTINLIVKVK